MMVESSSRGIETANLSSNPSRSIPDTYASGGLIFPQTAHCWRVAHGTPQRSSGTQKHGRCKEIQSTVVLKSAALLKVTDLPRTLSASSCVSGHHTTSLTSLTVDHLPWTAQQHGGEYKRIASDHDIIAQVKDIASVDKMTDVRTDPRNIVKKRIKTSVCKHSSFAHVVPYWRRDEVSLSSSSLPLIPVIDAICGSRNEVLQHDDIILNMVRSRHSRHHHVSS
ncbi:hypothetical protein BD769DRAFT_1466208 [Suillus cothurnatus]|nr:hypothetical protein BD769DRAFT_1466208 [Suillus cothurnatus]